MFKKRLLWQLYPSFLLIIFISVVAVAWYASHSFRNFHLNEVAQDLNSRANLIKNQISEQIAKKKFAQIDSFCKQVSKISSTRITIILPDGKVVADSDELPSRMKNHSDRPEFQEAILTGTGNSVRFSDTLGRKMMYQAIPITRNGEIIAVARTSVPVTAVDKTLSSIYQQLLWAGIVIAVCAAVIGLGVSKKISKPLERMTETAKNFAKGELNERLSLPNTTELEELAKTLNEMAYQLNEKIKTISEERSQMQAILYSMIEGILAVDLSGHILSINQAAAELLDIDASKSKGMNIEEVILNSQLQDSVKNILESGESSENNPVVLNDGSRFLQLYGSVLTDENENKTGAVLVLNDVTRTCQLERVRRDFVANVSHELKTPVTSIQGFVETLLEGAAKDTEQTKRFLNIIARHTDRLNAIIEDLLSLSRLEEDSETRRLSFEKVKLKPALESAVELSKVKASQKNIEIKLSCDKNISVKINSPLIEQAVLNLISNAVKYSEKASTVEIKVTQKNEQVLISVSDHGCGIGKKHLERIFERFYVIDKSRSRKLGGTGLGLAIVKHICQVHGGYITAESEIDKGSTFTIFLPGK